MNGNPSLFEINTRVWIKKFSSSQKIKLHEVPIKYWKDLKAKGIDYVWLMGVWQINKKTIEKYCFEKGLVHEYLEALSDWKPADVIGSPFSIDDYIVNPELGGNVSLIELRKQLNEIGIKLILDFIPNHFSSESHLINDKPEIFLQTDKNIFESAPSTFFEAGDKIFAHGKDPNYPAWKDTAQVNYSSETARDFMIEKLDAISELCDGVRCDMAMLVNNSIFFKTWNNIFSNNEKLEKPINEFWADAIKKIKSKSPEFTFIAEAYWDLEWDLQQFGFDFTYDKRLLDRLKYNTSSDIEAHLLASDPFQKKSVRFLENHDEPRVVKSLGLQKSKAAAVIISTIQGMRFYHDGQFEGKQIRLPVQLGREADEEINHDLRKFYNTLLKINKQEIMRNGKWEPLTPDHAWEDDESSENILVWIWYYKNERKLVLVNYSEETSRCSIKFDTKNYEEEFDIYDELNEVMYKRSAKEINNFGLYVELEPYCSHIFSY